jgi:Cu+-exporting ATPase
MNQHIPHANPNARPGHDRKSEPLSIPVDGMTCASCVRRVETGAAKVPGVKSSAVNFATRKLTVETEGGFDPQALEKAIRKLGYDIPAGAMDHALHEAGLPTSGYLDTSEVAPRGALAQDVAPFTAGVPETAPQITGAPEIAPHPNPLPAGGARGRAPLGAAEERERSGDGPSPRQRGEGGGSRMRGSAAGAARGSAVDGGSSRSNGGELMETQGSHSERTNRHPGSANNHAPAHRGEEAVLKRDLAIAFVLSLPLFVLEMTGHVYAPFHHWLMRAIDTQSLHYLYFTLATAVLFGPGLRFFRKGLPALLRGAPEMNSLVAIGVLAAYGYSLVTTFAPDLLPQAARHVYYEAATVIVTLILFGRLLEARATGRTGGAIEKLVGLQARTARVERDGRTVEIPAADVVPGDVVVIRPGERLPVDGTVIDGHSRVDEAMISGEPLPVAKTAGTCVTGGTINTSGSFRFRAEKVGRDTVLARIIRMVEQAQGAKLPIQSLVDRVTAWFVPAVMAIAALTFVGWFILGPESAMTHALISAVAVLIIACPCAMGLAVPVSIVVGGGRAAELGVLFRRGEALQTLQGVTTVVLDKTGTLTKGRPELTDLVTSVGFDEEQVLALVAAAEARSEHPIADALVKAAEARGLALAEAEDFSSITGYGITAIVAGRRVAVGADRFMEQLGLPVELFAQAAIRLADEGKTPLYAAIDNRPAAVLAVADPLKPGSIEAVRAFKAMGLKVAMVTGDNRRTAEAIAAQVGIDNVVAEVLPDGKVDAIRALRMTSGKGDPSSGREHPADRKPATSGLDKDLSPPSWGTSWRAEGNFSRGSSHKIAFVGDGINDAPALAAADIGIAIGTGTDVAIESADVVLVSGDLTGVVAALAVSRATMRNIKQNLVWAFGYNVALIPLAAGLFYPVIGLTLSPMLGAAAMALSSVFVVGNALRLRSFRPGGTR